MKNTKLPAIGPDIENARALWTDGKHGKALALCKTAMVAPDPSLPDTCILSALLHHLSQPKLAQDLWAKAQSKLDALDKSDKASVDTMLDTALVLADMNALDHAEALSRRAHDLLPKDAKAVTTLVDVLVKRDKAPEARTCAEAFCARTGDKFETLLYFATVFSHLEAEQAATHFLTTAQSRKKTKKQQARLNYLMAANGMPVAGLDQHNMAVAIFDSFADTFDEKLAQIGYQGPEMILNALKELDLPKKKTRRILDAGCGTGLCAEFLRGYAHDLVGVDISVNMLKKARKKAVHDTLTRTDLSERMTYPEGSFDMVVCADVLVYFGALDTVLANFYNILSPGGWLLVTVEDEDDPALAQGYRLHKSGRYKHAKGYLLRTLADTGFPKPKALQHAPIRDEMRKPIMGTVFAVQKSALSFG